MKAKRSRRHNRVASNDGLAAALSMFPTNWCDPLLTGTNAVIGNPPYDCGDIERLLMAIWDRMDKQYKSANASMRSAKHDVKP